MSETFHNAFAEALQSGTTDGLSAWLDMPGAAERFAVYRNNVVRSAIEALRAAYPSVNHIVGENFFSPLAKAFWEASPPLDQTMTLYGDGFDSFISTYAPASRLPYLPDIARLDRAWLEAHHGADCKPLNAARVAELAPSDLPALLLGLHPTARRVECELSLFDFWLASRARRVPEETRLVPGRQNILIWRHCGQVCREIVTAEHAVFLDALATPQPLGQALERAGPDTDESFAGRVFGHGLSNGLFVSLDPKDLL